MNKSSVFTHSFFFVINDVTLSLWFFDASKDTRGHILNNIVGKLDPPFSHCEIQFPCGTACSIYMGGTVTMRKRDYDLSVYTRKDVKCSRGQAKQAFKLASKFASDKMPFTKMGMIGTMLGVNVFDSVNSTFCSKLVADLLNETQVFELSSCNCTPSSIARTMTNHNVGKIPSKQCISSKNLNNSDDGSTILVLDFK